MKTPTIIALLWFSFVANASTSIEAVLCKSNGNKMYEQSYRNLTQEDDGTYIDDEKKGIRYGVSDEKNSNLIDVSGNLFKVDDLLFLNINTNKSTKIGADEISILQATLYEYKKNNLKYYCLTAPFAGIGSSGTYQRTQWAISFSIQAKSINDLTGRYGRCTSRPVR